MLSQSSRKLVKFRRAERAKLLDNTLKAQAKMIEALNLRTMDQLEIMTGDADGGEGVDPSLLCV